MSSLCLSSLLAMALLGLPPGHNRPILEILPAPFDDVLEAPGAIDATGGSPLAAPASPLPRQIVSLRPEGEFVKSGDVVAEFDPAPMEDRISELRIRFQEMQLSRADLAALHAARRFDAELRRDGSRGGAALAEIDRKRLAQESRLRILQSEAGLASAKRRLESAGNQLALANLQGDQSLTEAARRADDILQEIDDLSREIPRHTLRAENSGLIVHQAIPVAGQVRKAQSGDHLEAGQVFGRIPGEEAFVARIHLDERQAVRAKAGLPVEIELLSQPEQIINGSLIQILPSPALLAGRGNRPFQEALVKLPSPQGLKIGQSLLARIPVRHFEKVYAVPKDYLDGKTLWIAGDMGLRAIQAEPLFETDNHLLFDQLPGCAEGSPARIALPATPAPTR